MKQMELARELSDRLVATYGEFKDRGLSMDLYMVGIVSHAATLASYQEAPMETSYDFCANVMNATYDLILRKHRESTSG